MLKKITTTLIIATLMLLSSLAVFAAEDNTIMNVYVNGKAVIWTDAKPFITDGRTLIPMRAVAENLGATVTWDNTTSTAKLVLGQKVVELPVGKTYGLVNGVKVDMDVKTITVNGRTFIPLRFVSENLGYDITYKFGKDERADNKPAHIIDIKSIVGINTIADFRAGNYEALFYANGYSYEKKSTQTISNVHFISDDYITFNSRPTSTRNPGNSIFTVERYNGTIVITQYQAFMIDDELSKKFIEDVLDYLFQNDSQVLKDEILGSFLNNKIVDADGGIYSLAKVLETTKKVGNYTVTYTKKSIPNFADDKVKIVIKY